MNTGKHLHGLLIATAALCAACGGSHDAARKAAAVRNATSQTPTAEALMVTADAAVVPNDGSKLARITVYAIGKNNVLMANVPIALAVTSGVLGSMQPRTDSTGTATALVSVGDDPKPRAIIVTAMAGALSSKVSIRVEDNGKESEASRRNRLNPASGTDGSGKQQSSEKLRGLRSTTQDMTGVA
jgi:hypothetical protein